MESCDYVWRNNTNHWGPPLTTDHFWTEAKLIYDHDLLLALAIDILALKIVLFLVIDIFGTNGSPYILNLVRRWLFYTT